MTTKKNTFEEMEKTQQTFPGVKGAEPVASSNEINYEKMSDTAVGDKVKYVRENLDKKQMTIEKAQLFNANPVNDKIITAMNDKSKQYYKASLIVTYSEKNKDDVNHREYYSGCIQFLQKDGSLSEHSFWYEGAGNQVAQLWEDVAEFKKKDPKDLSPREFMGFLNGKPKIELENVEIKFNGKKFNKNLVGKFL